MSASIPDVSGRSGGRAPGLSLEAKVGLLTGTDNWHTTANEAIGLRQMAMSDGPAGVRGVTLDERNPSASLPSPSALGATWDPPLVGALARALGAEARGKGIDVLLAPTINIMRTPLGGRGFECFAEDPELTARLAVAYVLGLQSSGVAAAAKHFVCNESETGRWTYDARIAEQVLRELYLVPFEACVREAGLAVVMTGYNKVNGHVMTEHGPLLSGVLKDEWGFGGVVLSDWHAARSTAPTALAGLDLAMPGPDGPWGARLSSAVRSGEVPETMVDDKVRRVLNLARGVGALARPDASEGPAPVPEALLRQVAAAAFTLLRNDGVLPIGPRASVAVIGPNAVLPVTQGGGSATVTAAARPTPAQALAAAFPGKTVIAPGCATWPLVPEPPAGSLTDPVTGAPGVRLEFRAADGTLLRAEHRGATMFTWWDGLPEGVGIDGSPGSPGSSGGGGTIALLARYRAAADGRYVVGAGGVGHLTLTVDGAVAADGATETPQDPVQAMVRPGEIRAVAAFFAGQDAEIGVTLLPDRRPQGPVSIRLGVVPEPDEDAMLEEAVRAARSSDVAVVVVGSAPATESEGFDRAGLALPGRQDELVRRVAEANDRTVVVVNAGMPVLLPWAERVAAVGCAWLPGQEAGGMLADVLTGVAEPGGRLPVTIPHAESDCPVLHVVPEADGAVSYDEGLLIGYRGYDHAGTEPHFEFGHGLGYTTWAYESAVLSDAGPEVCVTVRNTGRRAGSEVVQAYLSPPSAANGRPPRVLAAFAKVTAGPGEAATARLTLPGRLFSRWDEAASRWARVPGTFTVRVGRSSRDLPLSVQVPP